MTENKKFFSNELAYVVALITLAIGTALMATADFGVSMVVAPAYILHLKISEFFPFFSFGMAEYSLQAVILILTSILLRRFRISYLFSFITAFSYGFVLDGMILLLSLIPEAGFALRIAYYCIGMLLCTAGVSLFFHTYIAPGAYELFVKEVSSHFGININKFKTAYDCTSCLLAIVLSFSFFGLWHFEGIKLGTAICTLINGALISGWTKFFDRFLRFEDKLPLRRFF